MRKEHIIKKSNRDYFRFEIDSNFVVNIPITEFPLPIHEKKDRIQQAFENNQ